jgi:uncharacterized protein (TIGR02266 family)
MREPRYHVDIRVDEQTSSMFTAGRVTNISRGGLFMETPTPLPIQSKIDLALQLPEIRTVLNLHGRVVWTYDIRRSTSQIMTGTGIKFEDMTPEQHKVLENYLMRLAPRAMRTQSLAAAH